MIYSNTTRFKFISSLQGNLRPLLDGTVPDLDVEKAIRPSMIFLQLVEPIDYREGLVRTKRVLTELNR